MEHFVTYFFIFLRTNTHRANVICGRSFQNIMEMDAEVLLECVLLHPISLLHAGLFVQLTSTHLVIRGDNPGRYEFMFDIKPQHFTSIFFVVWNFKFCVNIHACVVQIQEITPPLHMPVPSLRVKYTFYKKLESWDSPKKVS